MTILWITNTLFPDICKEIGIESPVVGSWMFSGAIALLNTNSEIKLAVAALYEGDHLKAITLNGITYFLVPSSGSNKIYNSKLELYWKDIQRQFLPDLVHIHGTEYPHGLVYINACGNHNVIVSIQGLVSVYERYYYGGIKREALLKNITLRDCLRLDTIFSQKRKMQQRGALEKLMIQSVNHVIGRTSWDKAHAWAINSQTNYHFCNETLRTDFYQHVWNLHHCAKHSIFLSQAQYPIKGLQQMIKALPIILSHYPDTKVYVAGYNFVTNRGWRLNGFGNYIRTLMKENGVTDKVIFTGVLSEKEMCNRYLASHVFVCPSSIENSPNSIGEAQLLGIPCVASFVGGISDMITNGETGLLYRFEEVEMLAAAICQIFSNDSLAIKLSGKGREVAAFRHDRLINAKSLSLIYQAVYSGPRNPDISLSYALS
jgi:glycosyltransferase involved in cell wall biosynthesis